MHVIFTVRLSDLKFVRSQQSGIISFVFRSLYSGFIKMNAKPMQSNCIQDL